MVAVRFALGPSASPRPVDGDPQYDQALCARLVELLDASWAALAEVDAARGTLRTIARAGVAREEVVQGESALAGNAAVVRAIEERDVVEAVAEPGELSIAGHSGALCLCAPVGREAVLIVAPWRAGGARDEVAEEALALVASTLTMVRDARRAAARERDSRWTRRLHGFARAIHDGALQRLFAVSLVLQTRRALSEQEREQACSEFEAALTELRAVLTVSAGDGTRPRPSLKRRLRTLECQDAKVRVEGSVDAVPDELQPLVEHFVSESIRNAAKHAKPSRVDVAIAVDGAGMRVDVTNDGVRPRASVKPGIGLSLLAAEARQMGFSTEFGRVGPDGWRARLVSREGWSSE